MNITTNVALSQDIAQTRREPEWRAGASTCVDDTPLHGDFADLSATVTTNDTDRAARAELVRMARERKDAEALVLLRDIKGKYNKKELDPFTSPYRAALTELKERRLNELAHHTDDCDTKALTKGLDNNKGIWAGIKRTLTGAESYDSQVDRAYAKKEEDYHALKAEQRRSPWGAREGLPNDGSRRPAGLESRCAVVKDGDNLVKILKQNGYSAEEANDPRTWQRVMRENKANDKAFSSQNPHLIHPGEEIIIPPPRDKHFESTSGPAPGSPEAFRQVERETRAQHAEETGEAKPKQAPDPEILARREMEARAARGDKEMRKALNDIKAHNELTDTIHHGQALPGAKKSYQETLTDIKWARIKEEADKGNPAAKQAEEELNSWSDWGGYLRGKMGFGQSERYNKRVDEYYDEVEAANPAVGDTPCQKPDPEAAARREMEQRAAFGDTQVRKSLVELDNHNEKANQFNSGLSLGAFPMQKKSYRDALTDIKLDQLKTEAKRGNPDAQKALEELNSWSDWGGWAQEKIGAGYGERYTRRVDEFYSKFDPHSCASTAQAGPGTLGSLTNISGLGIMARIRNDQLNQALEQQANSACGVDDLPPSSTNWIPSLSIANRNMMHYIKNLPPEEKKRLLSVIQNGRGAEDTAEAILNSDKTTPEEKQLATDFLMAQRATFGRLRELKKQQNQIQAASQQLNASPQEQAAIDRAIDAATQSTNKWIADQQRSGHPVSEEAAQQVYSTLIAQHFVNLSQNGHVSVVFGQLGNAWLDNKRQEQALEREVTAASHNALVVEMNNPSGS